MSKIEETGAEGVAGVDEEILKQKQERQELEDKGTEDSRADLDAVSNYSGGRTQQEFEDLARDPSHGNRIEPQGIKEREIGLDLEKQRKLGRIIRDPQEIGGAEFN